MKPKVSDRLAGVHPQMLTMAGEDLRKKLAVGQDIARALEIAGISQQQAAGLMGYEDQGTVSRWCYGKERPHFDKLFELPGFEAAWFRVRAGKHKAMTVRTVIEIAS